MALSRSKPLQRKRRPKRAAMKKRPLDFKMRTPDACRMAAKHLWDKAVEKQRLCAVCRKHRKAHGHHVVYAQHLPPGAPYWHVDNALRICPDSGGCHRQHHGRRRLIKTVELLDENVAYAFYLLGAGAYDYLRRYYDDSQQDPRLEAHLREETARAA